MWTQIGNTTLSSNVASSATVVTVNMASLSMTNLIDFWLVIAPFTSRCEIRKVIGGSSSGWILANGLTFNHSINDPVFIQTSPIWDIKLFGADPSHSGSENVTGITNASFDCDLNGGGIVWIPKGEYIINNTPDLSVIQIKQANADNYEGYIDIRALRNIKFIGEGAGLSVLKVEENYYGENLGLSIFNADSVKNGGTWYTVDNMEWQHMTLNGNRYNVELNEQSPGINLKGVSYVAGSSLIYQYATNTKISNVEFLETRGDGIMTLAVQNLDINNCRFLACGRSGITVQRGDQRVLIDGNYFKDTNDQDIDFEVTGTNPDHLSPVKFIISNNTIIKKSCNYLAVSLGGFSDTSEDEEYIFSGNTIIGGGVLASTCRNLIVRNNYIYTGTGKWGFQSIFLMDRFVFADNIIINNTNKLEAIAIEFDETDMLRAQNVQITGNSLTNGGMSIVNGRNLVINDNKIVQNGKVTSVGIKLEIKNLASDFGSSDYGNLTINGNTISQAGYAGVWLKSNKGSNNYNLVNIDKNGFSGDTLAFGIRIDQPNNTPKTAFWNQALVGTANLINSGNPNAKLIEVFESYNEGATPIQERWITAGFPESTVSAPQGALAVARNMLGDNKYLKSTLTTSKGWMPVSELDRQVLIEDEFLGSGPLNGRTPIPWSILSSLWSTSGSWNLVNDETKPNSSTAYPSGGPALAWITGIADGEIKLILRNTGEISTSTPFSAGLVFRYAATNSYWKLYFLNVAIGQYQIWLETVGSAGTPVSEHWDVTWDGERLINLKVILKDDFISVFYNDLMLYSLQNNYNQTANVHGMINTGYYDPSIPKLYNAFYSKSFKLLIH